jgi:5S rRNA maturation endonuclease (ribonuclease M5)
LAEEQEVYMIKMETRVVRVVVVEGRQDLVVFRHVPVVQVFLVKVMMEVL